MGSPKRAASFCATGYPRLIPLTITHELRISRQWPKQVGAPKEAEPPMPPLPQEAGHSDVKLFKWKGIYCQKTQRRLQIKGRTRLDLMDLSSQGPPTLRAASVLSLKSDEPLHTPHTAWPPSPCFLILFSHTRAIILSPSHGHTAGSTAWLVCAGSMHGLCITYGQTMYYIRHI